MMTGMRRRAKINLKLVIILVVAVVALGAGVFVARHVRRRILTARALAAGKAAVEKQDWPAACKHLKEYLSRNPDDVEMLKQFGQASLYVQPIQSGNIKNAIWAYRRVIRLRPTDDVSYDELARLYTHIDRYDELSYLAEKRMEHVPDDVKAPLWLGKALWKRRKPEEAREKLLELIRRLEPLPERHAEYVRACTLMAEMSVEPETTAAEGPDGKAQALAWLEQAVAYDAKSVEALVQRARVYRLMAGKPLAPDAKPVDPNALPNLSGTIGDWEEGKVVLLEKAAGLPTDANTCIHRQYSRPGRAGSVRVHAAFGVRARDLMPYRPEVWYPGDGWKPGKSGDQKIRLPLPDGSAMQCPILRFSRGEPEERKIVVVNYYIIDGKHYSDVPRPSPKAWRGARGIRHITQVQITCEDSAPSAVDAATQAVRDFASDSAQAVYELRKLRKLRAARADLARADELGTHDPGVRLLLSQEWMAHGELDRAAAELEAVKGLDQVTLSKYCVDRDSWLVRKFRHAASLAMRKQDAEAGAALADDILSAVEKKRHRVKVLPVAVHLYLAAAGRTADGRRCLEEYIAAQRLPGVEPGSPSDIALLRAAVAGAEDQLYQIINYLAPAVVIDRSSPELWGPLAEAYIRTDQPRRAIAALTAYLGLRPRDTKRMLQLAREHLKLRDWNRAFETARLAEAVDRADILIKLLRIEADIYRVVGRSTKPDEARLALLAAELAKQREKHPERVVIRILQAFIADYRGKHEEAEKELKLAIETCDEPLRAKMQLVRHYIDRAREVEESAAKALKAKAEKECRDACDEHAEVADPWLSLAGVLVENGKHGEAIASLRQGWGEAAGQWEKREVAIELAKREVLHDGDRSEAVRILKELAAKNKQEIHARELLLGIPKAGQGRGEAQKLVDEIRKIEGESGVMWRRYQAALWLREADWRSKQQEITEALKRCMELDPQQSAPALLLASMHLKLGNRDTAEEIYRQALVRNPAATGVMARLADLLEAQGRYPEAREILGRLDNPRVARPLSIRRALRQSEFSRAITELKLRVANDKRDAASRILLARLIYLETRNAKEAEVYLAEAEGIKPKSMALMAARVAIFKAEKRFDNARKILDTRAEEDESFQAYLMRAGYLADRGRAMKAEGRDEEAKKLMNLAERDYLELTKIREKGARGYDSLGKFYGDEDRLDDAVKVLEKATQEYPEDLLAKRNLMSALFQRRGQGDRKRALDILADLQKRLPHNPELMRWRADELLRDATPDSIRRAQDILERVVKVEPTSVEAHLRLIEITMKKSRAAKEEGDHAGARELATRARDLATRAMGANPDSILLMLARAETERTLGNTAMVRELVRMALRGRPANSQQRDLLITLALRNNDRICLEAAETLVARALAAQPKNEKLQLSKARILAAMGDLDAAVTGLEEFLQTPEGKDSVAVNLKLVGLYGALDDQPKADQAIERAESLDPKSPAVFIARLALLGSRKEFDEVVKRISAYRGRGVKKEDLLVFLGAAAILETSKDVRHKKEAGKLYERVLTADPERIDVRYRLASLYYQIDDVSRAEGLLRAVLQRQPNNARALNDLAWILHEKGQHYAEALALTNKGLRLAPENLHLLDTRGTILQNISGRLDDARADFAKAVELTDPGSPRRAKALLKLGRVCVKAEDADSAKRHFQEAKKIHQNTKVLSPAEVVEIDKVING